MVTHSFTSLLKVDELRLIFVKVKEEHLQSNYKPAATVKCVFRVYRCVRWCSEEALHHSEDIHIQRLNCSTKSILFTLEFTFLNKVFHMNCNSALCVVFLLHFNSLGYSSLVGYPNFFKYIWNWLDNCFVVVVVPFCEARLRNEGGVCCEDCKSTWGKFMMCDIWL